MSATKLPQHYYSASGSELLFLTAPKGWREHVSHLNLSPINTSVCRHFFDAIRAAAAKVLEHGGIVADASLDASTYLIVAGPPAVLEEYVSLLKRLHESSSGRLVFATPPSGIVDVNFDIRTPGGWKTCLLNCGHIKPRDIRRLLKRVGAGEAGVVCLRGGERRALIGDESSLRRVGARLEELGAATAGGAL